MASHDQEGRWPEEIVVGRSGGLLMFLSARAEAEDFDTPHETYVPASSLTAERERRQYAHKELLAAEQQLAQVRGAVEELEKRANVSAHDDALELRSGVYLDAADLLRAALDRSELPASESHDGNEELANTQKELQQEQERRERLEAELRGIAKRLEHTLAEERDAEYLGEMNWALEEIRDALDRSNTRAGAGE